MFETIQQDLIAQSSTTMCHNSNLGQGKIEPYHRSIKNNLLLENYYSPDELKHQIGLLIDHYNDEHYHVALDDLTPADVYDGKAREVLTRWERIKKNTMSKIEIHGSNHSWALNQ